jgi:hypothetical protein
MIKDYGAFIAHLKRTGRMKLLPRVLRELRREEAHAKRTAPKRETSADNPSLISGWRTLEGGTLTDHTGKSALIDMYRNIIAT